MLSLKYKKVEIRAQWHYESTNGVLSRTLIACLLYQNKLVVSLSKAPPYGKGLPVRITRFGVSCLIITPRYDIWLSGHKLPVVTWAMDKLGV